MRTKPTWKLEALATQRRAISTLNIRCYLSLQTTDTGLFFSSLSVGESLWVPTFVNNGLLLDGNLAQCQSIYNSTDVDFMADGDDDVVAGQYAIAAIDGKSDHAYVNFELSLGMIQETMLQ